MISSRSSSPGEVTEWPKVHDWKSCVAKVTGGSTPPLSAIFSLCEKRGNLLRQIVIKFFEEKFYGRCAGEAVQVLRNEYM